jgi:GntR family transcriptional regulator, transcriptional repressor for pyruvate dehydrogenase complex
MVVLPLTSKGSGAMKSSDGVTAEIVVQHVRGLIERGELRPGDRLPAERELAVQLGVSRPSVRAGLRSLSAIGVLQTRHGAGTFITDGPPTLGSEPLSFLAALHGFTRDEMFEARRALEVGVAGLAAERANDEQIATIAEEITGMFAALDDPQTFLIHDIRFHRSVAEASGNPILASLVEMVSALFYEQRRKTAQHGRDLKESAHLHRAIYHAIRAHDAKRASAAMSEHLSVAQQAQALESPLRDDRTAPLDAPAALMSVNGTGMPSINGTNGTSMVAGPSNGSVGANVHGPAARRPIRQAARLLPSPLR